MVALSYPISGDLRWHTSDTPSLARPERRRVRGKAARTYIATKLHAHPEQDIVFQHSYFHWRTMFENIHISRPLRRSVSSIGSSLRPGRGTRSRTHDKGGLRSVSPTKTIACLHSYRAVLCGSTAHMSGSNHQEFAAQDRDSAWSVCLCAQLACCRKYLNPRRFSRIAPR